MNSFDLDIQQFDFQKILAEQAKREAAYIQMSTEELSVLSDDELCNAVWTRTENIVSSNADFAKGVSSLNKEQRIFYTVFLFEMEINNGGLCQFLVNEGDLVAPFVSECMEMIGATEHARLYQAFMANHQIDSHILSSFACKTEEDYVLQYNRYPFDEYDDKFSELAPLQSHLLPFVKKYIEKL